MSATNVSIRLGVEGKAEIKRAFEEIGQSGQAAFGSVEKALDRTGTATDREVARLRRLAEAARLASEAETSQRRFNAILNVDRPTPKSARDSAGVFEEAMRETESFAARANTLRATIDPLGAAQARLNRELAEYATLARRDAITSAEHSAAQMLARQRFDQTSQAITGVGRASGLTRAQLLTLQYTFNDVVASMSTGMSPMTILMQQGGQVTQAFGGLRGTLSAFGAALGVVGGIVSTVAVTAASLTAAWAANESSTRAVTVALSGLGRTSGATAAGLERIAIEAAESGKVSVTAAREMEVAFLRAGRIGVEEMGRAISVARNFAVTMGVETTAGVEQLAKALADPAHGADELNSRLAFLDDRTRQYIRTLSDQNNRTEAQRVLLNALIPALADAEQATNAFGRAWSYVARQATNAFDAIGRTVERAVDGRSRKEELDLLLWQKQELLRNSQDGDIPLMLPQVEARIRTLQGELGRQEQAARKNAAEAAANELSIRAGDIARDITPGFRELERLKSQQAALKAAIDDPAARAKLANPEQVEDAYRRISRQIEIYRPPLDAAAKAEEAHAKSLRHSEAALERKTKAVTEAARRTRESGDSEIDLLKRRLELQGTDPARRDEILARLRSEHDLRRRGIDLASEEGRAIIDNAGRIETLTRELQQQDAAYRAIETAAGSALDRFGEVLAQGKTDWKSWADAGRSALQDLSREMVRLAVLSPLKNMLFGSNLPTFGEGGGLPGDIFARLFHEGGLVGDSGAGRIAPLSLFAGAPRFHDGAYLRPDEVPAILQRGERVLNRREAADYQRGRGARAAPIALTFNVATPDASSFRRAQSQITAEMAAAIERARRNL